MPRSNNRGGRNNNPAGRNQYSDRGVMEMARERPIAAAAAAAGAAAAGVFLWSRRAQISDRLSTLSDQFSEWREGMSSDDTSGAGESNFDDTAGLTTSGRATTGSAGRGRAASRRGMSETGSGNASLGASSGGGGMSSSASGRGRARQAPTS